MSLLNKFKDKKFCKLFTLIGVLGIVTVTSATILISSYAEWSTYYNAIMEEKKEQEEMQKMPLTFKGIEAKLSDTVSYFNNGRATPKASDFIVMVNFSEKGQNKQRRLKAEEYSLVIPDDFALEGGEVEVKYIYIGEEENATPIEAKAKVKISLVDVVLSSMEIVEKPYVVYYKEGEKFNPEGFKGLAHYNDGTSMEIDSTHITYSEEKLKQGQESIIIKCQNLETELPIKVDSEALYDDGEVISIQIEGNIYVEEGVAPSNIKTNVRASYESGNRLLLNDNQYTISGKGIPSSSEPYIVTATLNELSSITTEYLTYVQTSYESEEATTTLNKVFENSYSENGTLLGNIECVQASNGLLTYSLNATEPIKSRLSIKIANKGQENIPLNQILSMRVNNRLVGVPAYSILKGTKEDNKTIFYEYSLSDLSLNTGNNKIELLFNGGNGILVDKISTVSGGSGTIDNSLGFYFADCISKEKEPVLEIEQIKNWGELSKVYGHGICSDGKYIYGITSTNSGSDRGGIVYRYNPEDNSVIQSAQIAQHGVESNFGISYYDGKIIVFSQKGVMLSANASSFVSGTVFSTYTDLQFKDLKDSKIVDLYYNQSLKKYAVTELNGSSYSVKIYNKDRETYIDMPLKSCAAGGYSRISGDSKHIYVTYKKDGLYNPTIQVYSWEGKYVGEIVIPSSPDKFGATTDQAKKTNAQGIAILGEYIYYSMSRWQWGGGDSNCLMRAKVNESTTIVDGEQVASYSLGEYVDAAISNLSNVNVSASQVLTANGQLPKPNGKINDVISDNKYYYMSVSDNDYSTFVYKIDLKSHAIIAKSKKINLDNVHSNYGSRLLIKDNALYCISTSGKGYYINLNNFVANCEFVKDDNFNLRDNILPFYDDIHYENSLNRYVAISNIEKKLDIITAITTSTVDLTPIYNQLKTGMLNQENHSSLSISAVTGDDKYIYVTFASKNQKTLPLVIFDYEGNQVGDILDIALTDLNISQYIVDCIFVREGKLYLNINSLGEEASIIWLINQPSTL